MPRVEVEPGVCVHVQDVGAGRPVVLLAGFGLSHDVWDGQVRALAGAGYRALCVDLRGTGGSDKPDGGYSMDRLAGDVSAVLDQLGLEDVSVLGWSFGGQVAFSLAATAPGRLAQIGLIASNGVRASRSEDFPFGPEPDKLQAALVRAEINARIATRRRTVGSAFLEPPDPDLLEWLVRIQLQMPSWSAIACYDTYLQTDMVGLIDDVRLPVLQLIGDSDPVTIPEGAVWLSDRLADTRLVTIENCGHYPMFETPQRFDDELLKFLGEV